ncbi:MAG: DUF6364 family protein [Ferruginibacter sp.]
MKTRLNITIEENILSEVKLYASKQNTSVSELVEDYFTTLTKIPKKKNIIQLIESMKPATIEKNADLKELFYKEQSGKYGF